MQIPPGKPLSWHSTAGKLNIQAGQTEYDQCSTGCHWHKDV